MAGVAMQPTHLAVEAGAVVLYVYEGWCNAINTPSPTGRIWFNEADIPAAGFRGDENVG